ncbi:hypothetical protein DRW07_02160 [Alteromonas sediminis]|uniref:Recombinase domain-containing protein n=1 Tax=Alteromonas sediminis TaxID=2259342 RepID=A0A3N5ZAR8_9ALTE|nr:recombinase family protein [Alteromonas sediminis]RPJ68234.1 hypothetical protein DRW07_02160 [Alteromonas sediminis]
MNRKLQRERRQYVLQLVYLKVRDTYKIPSYKSIVFYLNEEGIKTSRGNPWTRKALFRFLQNAGYSGLWGLSKCEGLPNIKLHSA